MVLLFAIFFAFVVACIASYGLSHPASPIRFLDYPNERSLHSAPMPRTGGMGICVAASLSCAVVVAKFGVRVEFLWIAGATLMLGLVSLADDRSHIPVWLRLVVQSVAACLLLIGGLRPQLGGILGFDPTLSDAVVQVLSALFVVWMINLYNFMDGMDGFAGGMSVIGFGTLGLFGFWGGDGYFATICWIVSASAAGFLVWNFPPARIFMGDVGSSVLGLMAAAMSLWGDRLGLFPIWIAILVFSPFVVDATVTLLMRALHRERVWEAHCNHYYQRLVRTGWGHRRTVLVEYGLMAACSVTAVVLIEASTAVKSLGLGVWVVIYLAGMYAVRRAEVTAARSSL